MDFNKPKATNHAELAEAMTELYPKASVRNELRAIRTRSSNAICQSSQALMTSQDLKLSQYTTFS